MPLVACAECAQQVSDIAETCPHCGTPQPKKWAAKDATCQTCKFCDTFNLVQSYSDDKKCRGCQRLLIETCEEAFVRCVARRAYEKAVDWGKIFAGVVTAVTVLCVGLVAGPSYGCSILCPLIFGGAFLYYFANIIFRWAVIQFSLPSLISSSKHLQMLRAVEARGPKPLTDAAIRQLNAPVRVGGGPVAVAVSIGFVGFMLLVLNHASHESAQAAQLTENIGSRLRPGLFSTDFVLTHEAPTATVQAKADGILPAKPRVLSKCSLIVTVLFETGAKMPIERYWERWEVGEEKTINIPSHAKVERIDVKGTVWDSSRKVKEDVNLWFTFTARK